MTGQLLAFLCGLIGPLALLALVRLWRLPRWHPGYVFVLAVFEVGLARGLHRDVPLAATVGLIAGGLFVVWLERGKP